MLVGFGAHQRELSNPRTSLSPNRDHQQRKIRFDDADTLEPKFWSCQRPQESESLKTFYTGENTNEKYLSHGSTENVLRAKKILNRYYTTEQNSKSTWTTYNATCRAWHKKGVTVRICAAACAHAPTVRDSM